MDYIFSVSEFNEVINQHLSLLGEITIRGEISQMNVSQGRWLFITIKDKESSVEVFSVLDRIYNYASLEEGMDVYIYGEPKLYKRSGRFSILASKIEPAGEGALKIAFEKLKKKLESEGIFDVSRKRALSKLPQNVGLLTAKDSQAEADFLKVLKERIGGVKITFYPISVQGDKSIKSIIRGIKYLNNFYKTLDLIVLTRGGGSLEDLKSFNDEKVVRAIYSSKIPIVSAVGHEKDVTLADLVADVRASTPSNAAEIIFRDRVYLSKQIMYLVENITRIYTDNLIEKSRAIDMLINILLHSISIQQNKLQKIFQVLDYILIKLVNKKENMKNILLLSKKQIYYSFKSTLQIKRKEVLSLERLMQNLDYRKILKKGFSISFNYSGKIIKSVNQISREENIKSIFTDGFTLSKIYKIERSEDEKK